MRFTRAPTPGTPGGRLLHGRRRWEISTHLCIRKAREDQTPAKSYWNLARGRELPEGNSDGLCRDGLRFQFSPLATGDQREPNLDLQAAFGAIPGTDTAAVEADRSFSDG